MYFTTMKEDFESSLIPVVFWMKLMEIQVNVSRKDLFISGCLVGVLNWDCSFVFSIARISDDCCIHSLSGFRGWLYWNILNIWNIWNICHGRICWRSRTSHWSLFAGRISSWRPSHLKTNVVLRLSKRFLEADAELGIRSNAFLV